MDFIIAPTVVGIITLGIYRLFELYVRKKERILLIDKLVSTLDNINPNFEHIMSLNFLPRNKYATLKGACLLIGLGFGILAGFLIHLCVTESFTMIIQHDVKGVIYGAPIFICGGLGLVFAFILEMKFSKKKQQ